MALKPCAPNAPMATARKPMAAAMRTAGREFMGIVVAESFRSSLPARPFSLRAMDWSTWQPRERANLCFIVKDGKVLLIRKKRGLGAGKINGPGGKLEPGETAHDAAVREVQEEIGVTPLELEDRGELHFQFADGYSLHCAVFVATDLAGEPAETAEATPFWVAVDDVP